MLHTHPGCIDDSMPQHSRSVVVPASILEWIRPSQEAFRKRGIAPDARPLVHCSKSANREIPGPQPEAGPGSHGIRKVPLSGCDDKDHRIAHRPHSGEAHAAGNDSENALEAAS